MKVLMFNHHPDYYLQLHMALEEMGADCYMATRDLTFECGADYCSTHDGGKLQMGDFLVDEEALYGKKVYTYKDNLDDIDYIFTMNRDIAKNLDFDPNRLFFGACVHWDLNDMNDSSKYRKITSHHDADKFNAEYLPFFCPQRGELEDKTYLTQLISGWRNVPWLEELAALKNEGKPVIIAGAQDAPDGFVNDWEVLKHTSLLVHWKDYGTNCNSIMKALDTGIPVYTSRDNRLKLGMKDLPDELFFFSDDMSMSEAFNKSKDSDNTKIQETFRSIRNVENTAKVLEDLLSREKAQI